MTTSTLPLAGWNDFCRLPQDFDLRTLGFAQSRADVNRFRARYRAAAAFRTIELEGYSKETSQGYAAFCRVLFVYSAFESFLALIDKNPTSVGPLLEKHGSLNVLQVLWSLDRDHAFYGFLHERVRDRLKFELEQFVQLNPCNVALLAGAIRHIFAHGYLTPNAAGGSPKRAANICNTVATFLLIFMSAEFSQMVKGRPQSADA